MYEVVWGQEGEVKGSTAGEGDEESICRGAPAPANVARERGHRVTSSDGRPSTCGTGSLGSTEGNEVEQQFKAAWAWERGEDALEGA